MGDTRETAEGLTILAVIRAKVADVEGSFNDSQAAIDTMAELGDVIELARDLATFAAIYPGRGENAPRSPLAEIHPQAEALALFAVTVGAAVSQQIDQLFDDHNYPLAAALDAAASLAADSGAAWMQKRFTE